MINSDNWLQEKSWIELHFQFGKFPLLEVLNYSYWIVKHSETTKHCGYLPFISHWFCKLIRLNLIKIVNTANLVSQFDDKYKCQSGHDVDYVF